MEDIIKIYKNIDIKRPVMIAGWPGMGSVALGVVDYLQRKLAAKKFAEIKIGPFETLDSVHVKDGLARLPDPPKSAFYYTKDPDIVIFQGEIQLAGEAGIRLVRRVIDFASTLNVARIYTAAAFPMPVSYKEEPKVFAASNRKAVCAMLSKFGVQEMAEGHIAGLNGLLVGFASEKDIEAACLLATMPQYAIGLPNPKASGAIIEVLRGLLRFKVEMQPLTEFIKDMDEKMALIEEKVKDVLILDKDTRHETRGPPIKPPPYIIEKIERLFREATQDKAKGLALKKELDRWDLYKAYEDRFLDLFKDG